MTTEPTGAIDMHNYEQNAHLPECIALAVRMEYDDAFCICPEVRACEARVEDERRRVRATVIPILVALARYTPTDTNAEQTEQVINRAVMRIKSAIDNEEE